MVRGGWPFVPITAVLRRCGTQRGCCWIFSRSVQSGLQGGGARPRQRLECVVRLILTLAGLRTLALSLLSSDELALAAQWLLQIFWELVGGRGGDGAVLGGRASPPAAACRERRGAGLVLTAAARCRRAPGARGAGPSPLQGQDGGDVNPCRVWLRTSICFVFGESILLVGAPVISLRVLVCWLTFPSRVRDLQARRTLAFALVLLGALVLQADARALEEHRRRRGGVCTCPAQSALLQKKHKGFFFLR